MRGLDPYQTIVHGFQALRRRTERDERALLGALGVAAEPLPHQLANVRRILDATEIRHLIADGVGLGKTVQTLMILNALRLADPDHRTLLVVPHHLAQQWSEEFLTRGHLSVAWNPDEEDTEEHRSVRLVRPADLIAEEGLLKTAPDRFDMLVLDEPQTFTVEERGALARTRPFAQFLTLTATPGFGNAALREWLLRMLEPARSDIARFEEIDALSLIAAEEDDGRRDIETGMAEPTFVFERDALARRVCRWSRDDWPDFMPVRRYRRYEATPFAHEERLSALARAVLNNEVDRSGSDTWRRAQALHRLGRAANEAVAALPESVIDAAGPVAGADEGVRGDSRFDALLDCLGDLWARKTDARVLIVAGDNPTIVRLEQMLTAYFQNPEDGTKISSTRFSRGDQSAGDTADAVRETHERLAPFIHGKAQILFIGEWAQAGLNLHHVCDEIIFYSCPWDVRAVDQLIGRLDRLRSGAERHALQKRPQGKIGITVITWEGSAEARVVDGLERLGVFERPTPPSTVETEREIAGLLQRLGAGRGGGAALVALGELGVETSFEAALSMLAPANPHTAHRARQLYDTMSAASPLPGALPGMYEGKGARGAEEEALTGWLEAIREGKVFDARLGVKDKSDLAHRYSSIWYSVDGQWFDEKTIPFSVGLFDRRRPGDRFFSAAAGLVAFNTRRRHLAQPPILKVKTNMGEKTLQFLDHGDPLHEDLCAEFLTLAAGLLNNGLPHLVVTYPENHPALCVGGPVAFTIAHYRAQSLPCPDTKIADALAMVDNDDRALLNRWANAGFSADERWLALRRSSLLTIAASQKTGEGWRKLPVESALKLLDPRNPLGPERGARYRNTPPPRGESQGIAVEMERQLLAVDVQQSAICPLPKAERLAMLDAEMERMREAETLRAAAMRARASDDTRQRKIVDSQALRIEKRLAFAKTMHSLRREGLSKVAEPSSIPTIRCWQFVIVPIEAKNS